MIYFDKLWAMSPTEREISLERKVNDAKADLFNNEILAGTMAETSGADFDLDIQGDFNLPDPPMDEIRITLEFSAYANEQLEDRIPSGRLIKGICDAVINEDGNVRFDRVSASVADL